MAIKQKSALNYMKSGFKIWVLILLANIIVMIIMIPILLLLGFALGAAVIVVFFILLLPLNFLIVGWVFDKFHGEL